MREDVEAARLGRSYNDSVFSSELPFVLVVISKSAAGLDDELVKMTSLRPLSSCKIDDDGALNAKQFVKNMLACAPSTELRVGKPTRYRC